MKKLHPLIRSEMFNTFADCHKFMLDKNYQNIMKECKHGFLFSYDEWIGDYKIEKVQHIENVQYAVIDVLFNDFVNYLETTDDFTNEEIKKFKLVDEIFHEYLRELAFFKFKDDNILTIEQAIDELRDINGFMPNLILKDGQLIDIRLCPQFKKEIKSAKIYLNL